MKKLFVACMLCLLVISCKEESKEEVTTFSGMFLYLESEKAAVFQAAGSQMYGVVLDDQMLALNERCKQYKKEAHNMVPVVIRGVRKPNPVKDAWKEVIEIKEIVSVQKPSESQDGTIIIKNNQ
jgi:hypothetical protein